MEEHTIARMDAEIDRLTRRLAEVEGVVEEAAKLIRHDDACCYWEDESEWDACDCGARAWLAKVRGG